MSSILPKLPFSENGHIGISIDATTVRAVLLNATGSVVSQAEHRFAKAVITTDHIDIENLSQGLKKVVEETGFNGRFAAVVIPEKFAFSRQHTLPAVSTSEIDEAVSWQTESIFPFPKSDIYIDWKILSTAKEETTLLLVAIQKKLLDQLKNACEAAGLSPISFEPSAASLIRLTPKDEKNLIIVELSEQGTSSTLIQNGVSSLTTTTYFNQESSPDTVLSDLSAAINSILTKIKQEDTLNMPAKLYVTGEKASGQIAEVLSKQLDLATTSLELNGLPTSFHVAYAAASSQVLPPENENSINLLPTGLTNFYHAKYYHQMARSTLKLSSIILAVALILSLGLFLFSFITLNQAKAPAAAPPAPGSGEKLTPAVVQRIAQRYNTLFPLKKTPEQDIVTIINQLPQGISISSLNFETKTKTFTLTGTAEDRELLVDFKKSLESTGEYSRVTLPLSSLESADQTNFSMEITLKTQP